MLAVSLEQLLMMGLPGGILLMGQEDGGLVNLEAEIQMSRSGFWRWLEKEKELMMCDVVLII